MQAWLHTRPLHERVSAWVLAVGIPVALLVGLTLWTTGPLIQPAEEAPITVVDVPVPPPPPEPEPTPPPSPPQVTQPAPKPLADPEPEGGAAPPNIRSRASPIVAPKPVVVRKPFFTAAPVPADGSDSSSGASDVAGPGTGAGGQGNGLGSGRGGDGMGGGGGGTVPAVDAVKVAGNIGRREYRRPDGDDATRRTVGVNFTVTAAGRVTGCRVAEASGDPALDRFTCARITQRWRYRPARDRLGRPVASEEGWYQVYTFDGSDPVLPGR